SAAATRASSRCCASAACRRRGRRRSEPLPPGGADSRAAAARPASACRARQLSCCAPMTDPGKVLATFHVNGEPLEGAFAPHKTLLEVLREDLVLTGTKHGCELGECGTCTVQLDGVPVLSCLVLGLDAVGRQVRTVEGLADGPELQPLQHAFADLGAAQCGYCTPGILMTADPLLAPQPPPSPAD